ncbi:hypothetical protein MMH89_02430 [Candidatus Comchoanobacter bicostacola]|uniref:Uncharacterized protein n=1 Tax=Candidatus Comchoanobacter bicostacola TaxID=2919598 RepID=A0ABY5DJ81_9GAMM|nr:hypothetical protein [Candidatus Comchoanobacter bicostacola]UTC24083.1 hypothetical protein MMH89_02430 [Candidatus Comchoanobacter bicostacola]
MKKIKRCYSLVFINILSPMCSQALGAAPYYALLFSVLDENNKQYEDEQKNLDESYKKEAQEIRKYEKRKQNRQIIKSMIDLIVQMDKASNKN